MAIKTIYFASANSNKIEEIQRLIGSQYKLVSLSDLGITDDIEETGTTYQENAMIKARHLVELGYSPVLAEDSGFEFEALNNNPGVYSKRMYPQPNDNEAMTQLLVDIKDSGNKSIQAFAVSCLILYANNEYHVQEVHVRGNVTTELKGTNGYMYDKVFCPEVVLAADYVNNYDNPKNLTYAEMTLKQRDIMSARNAALDYLITLI